MNNPSHASRPHTPRSPSTPSTPAPGHRVASRRVRPARGIDVPTSIWLPPTTTSPGEENQPGILPGWARTRLAADHTTAALPGLIGVCRDIHPGPQPLIPLATTRNSAPTPATVEADRAGLVLLEVADIFHDPATSTRTRAVWLQPSLDAALAALAPGAVLAIAFGNNVLGPAVTLPGHAIAAARRAGFTYQQHLIVITAALHGDRLIPRPTNLHRHNHQALKAAGLPLSHRAHRDLFLFTAPTRQETISA